METTIMLVKLLGLLSLTIDTRSCSFLDWNGDVHNTFNDGPSARRQRRNVTMADDALTSENVTQYANVSTTSVPKPQWWHDLYSDKYYGSKQYLERKLFTDNPDKEPTICFNNNTLHNKGVTLGRFVCPMANQSDTFVHCCGKSKEQQCCSQKKEHAEETESITDELVTGLSVAAAFVIALTFCMIIYCCCGQRRPEIHDGIKLMWVRRSFGKELNRLEQPAYQDHMTVVNSITGLRESRGPSRQGSRGPSRQGSVRSNRSRRGSFQMCPTADPTPSVSRRPSHEPNSAAAPAGGHRNSAKHRASIDRHHLGSDLPNADVVITVTTPSDEHGPTAPLLKTVQQTGAEHI